MTIISSRCTNVVPIYSKAFFRCNRCIFFANFAQYNTLQNQGVVLGIIPIIFGDKNTIPLNLREPCMLNYKANMEQLVGMLTSRYDGD